jgi:prepilin-type N-terminal cleavage/methylation domain-containing protein
MHARSQRAGFTLLEICIVLVILGVLMGVIAPGMQSALNEQAVRSDAHRLSLLVKAGMLRSNEEHRSYVLTLDEKNWSLLPLGDNSAQPDSDSTWQPGSGNKLLLPNEAGKWLPNLSTQWDFRPGELCPATPVRFTRGKSELEMTFNALTGNVEDERSIFP